ncbi:MAG: ankyrin repeat domain-containing protein, partial [bacterium]
IGRICPIYLYKFCESIVINRTALMWAACYGHPKIAELLIENGAKIDAKDNHYYRTPLEWAVVHDQVEREKG